MNYFDDPNSKHFSFESFAEGLDEDTFGVINFKGYEAISQTYDFEIMLVSSNKEIDLEDVLQSQAVFTIHRASDDNVLYNGIIAEFDQLHEVNDVIFYRARLVPKLWWLTLTHHNQVFLNQSVTSFVEDALRDGGLESADFDIGTLSGYEDIDYTCQYDESHFNFVSRWLERQGIYYYFTQESDGEVLMLTDTKFSHDALKQGADLFYNPASGLEGKHLGEAIGSFTCRQKQLPAEIILKDYNYERPSLDITSHAAVDPAGRGISYIYGEFFATAEEGERLANIRAEELLCQKQEFFGESTVPYIMPGFTFNLNNHYREDFNQEYLILEVTHEGNQSHLMSGGIATDAGKSKNQAIYRNSFKAIPNEVQYRPQRLTVKPKISGTIHAKIDSEVDSEYAQIDEQGRYRVKLPFDINEEHMDGKGSAPIRMMQPYAGKNRGMQFPLAKGTEVLLTFIEGNPDRPVIAGAVSNPETQGPVNADNQTESVIRSGGNNRIRMEDQAGKQRVMLESPAANSWIRIGEPNDPVALNGSAEIYLEVGETYYEEGAYTSMNGVRKDITAPTTVTGPGGATQVDTSVIGDYSLEYVDGTDTALRVVKVVADKVTARETVTGSGIRLETSANCFFEAQSRFAFYTIGTPSRSSLPYKSTGAPADAPNQIGDILDKFHEVDSTTNEILYAPTGMISMAGVAQTSFKDEVLPAAIVQLTSCDTVNTQEGNVYDFGGYWSYNLGNGYTEEHIDQSPELNIQHSYPWPSSQAGDSLLDLAVMGGITGGVALVATISAVVAAGSGPNAPSIGGGIACGIVNGGVAAGIGMLFVKAVEWTSMIGPDGQNFQGNIGDVIDGPGSDKEIYTWAEKVGSSVDATTKEPRSTPEDDYDATGNITSRMNTDTTWVTKQFGDSYNFTRGNEISIKVGHSEEHNYGNTYEFTYGGMHEETKFNGDGRKVSYERGGGGTKTEIDWHHVTGKLTNFSYKDNSWFSYEGNFVTMPTLSVSTSMSTLKANVDVSVGAMDIKASLAVGITMDISATAGLAMKFSRAVGGELINDETTQGFEFKAVGMKAAKKAAMEADAKNMVMEKVLTQIGKHDLKVENNALKVSSGQMTLDGSAFKFF